MFSCSSGVPVDPVEVTSEAGLYTMHLHTEDAVAGTDFHLGLHLMSDGEAVSGASLTVTPFMPEMGHGIAGTPEVSESDGGEYDTMFTFSMSGYWEIDVMIHADPGTDHAVFAYEVD